MLKIGITGGIGSGKTTVCRIFESIGIPVYNADIAAKNIVNFDKNVTHEIVSAFGSDILDENDFIDRKKLGAIVFNDKEKLKKLNSIVHPAVAKHFADWLEKNKKSKYILKEAAILFESGAYKAVDSVITVVAPKELRIKRSIERDSSNRAEIEQRMNNQMSDEEKIKLSDYVIYNNESELLIPQILKLHEQLIK